MPIYEYVCPHCGNEYEELVRSQTEVVICPECEKDGQNKRMSAAAFRCGAGLSLPSSSSDSGSGCGSCAASSCAGCK